MPLRFLVGPLAAAEAGRFQAARQQGQCLLFNDTGAEADLAIGPEDSWEQVCSRLPDGWRPDFVLVVLPQADLGAALWQTPVPLVALALDWELHWHGYRLLVPHFDLVLCDAPGAALFQREGHAHVRPLTPAGLSPEMLSPAPGGERPIDVLALGGIHPHRDRQRLPWLDRLARLGSHRRVLLQMAPPAPARQALLRQSRIVFVHSRQGECPGLVLEGAASGALVFVEADNTEVPRYLQPGREYVAYRGDNLEALLEHYLHHETERQSLAAAGLARVQSCSAHGLWQSCLERLAGEWSLLQERAERRLAQPVRSDLLMRTWYALSRGKDGGLAAEVRGAIEEDAEAALPPYALGVLLALAGWQQGRLTASHAEQAALHFQQAVTRDRRHVLAGLGLIHALLALDQKDLAREGLLQSLAMLEQGLGLHDAVLWAPPFPPGWDALRIEWERAAWQNAGQPVAERQAKRRLLGWRLYGMLADLTGELAHYQAAAELRPDLPGTQAALGCALGRAGQPRSAAVHLRQALQADPFDSAAARALYQALEDGGDQPGQQQLVRERLLLARAAPGMVPVEDWLAQHRGPTTAALPGTPLPPSPSQPSPPSADATPGQSALPVPAKGRPRVSLCMIVRNEENNLPACLESVADLVDEIVVVDTGSEDRTREVAAHYGARVHDFPWCDSFAAARNESLRHATGQWVFWLDADDRLDEVNRHKLRTLFAGLGEDNAAYVIKCLCLPEPHTGASIVVDHVRLFRSHPQLRWHYRVHEQILPALRRQNVQVHWTDVVVQHSGYQDAALRQRKRQRDLRLLLMENGERPDDPFTLFNLGALQHELGRPAAALPFLQRSLERSQPTDSIVRKLFALLTGCHRQLGQRKQALVVCRQGQRVCGADPEMLFLEGLLRMEEGDLAGAEACLQAVLQTPPAQVFGSIDPGLRGYKARHNLAVLYQQQGRAAEAESLWRQVVQECPCFLPAWLGLAEQALERQDWPAIEEMAARLQSLPGGAVEAAVVRGRSLLARRDFTTARATLEEAISLHPDAVHARVILSHTLLQEGKDLPAAQQVLQGILARDPHNRGARHNLNVLLGQRLEEGGKAA